MGKTTNKTVLDGITLLDSSSRIRNNLLKRWFPNNVDGVRFYEFTGKLSQIPLIGIPIKKSLHLYYRYLHTNSLIFPLKDIEQIINNSTHLYVDPCPCRLAAGENVCDAPLFVCMRINHSAELRKEQANSKGLSKKDALDIMRTARKYGMVFSLESCIQPYQYNICTCCTCCCIGMKMRYELGLDVYHSGPYVPEFKETTCNECETCINKCPGNAISFLENKPIVNLNNCLGCGTCSEVCPENSITMVKKQERVRKDTEPGPIRLFLSLTYIYLFMIPTVLIYRIFTGSQRYKSEIVKSKPSDYFKESMQPDL